MFSKLSSAVSSLKSSPAPQLTPDHNSQARGESYTSLANDLSSFGVPVSHSDCAKCDTPCPPSNGVDGTTSVEIGSIWDGKTYTEYVEEKYGDLGELPIGFDCDWESELTGSAKGGRGRICVISTGRSDWSRDHYDDKDTLSHHLHNHIQSLNLPIPPEPKGSKDFNTRQPPSTYIFPSALPPPSQPSEPIVYPPSLYSSSLLSQSDDPEDQTVLVFPDWKVVQEIENSKEGSKALFDGNLDNKLGRAGASKGSKGSEVSDRIRSWTLPYRAVILLCSHKRRDKRCHIAAPLLRAALHTVLNKYDISIDETGSSLAMLDSTPLEDLTGSKEEKEKEVAKRIESIEGVKGGNGGEVGIFNINHLGGHRYAGVMLILFPSGAYLSYGRVTPQEIPRVVEDTILQGKIVPGLLRNAVGVRRKEGAGGNGFLGW